LAPVVSVQTLCSSQRAAHDAPQVPVQVAPAGQIWTQLPPSQRPAVKPQPPLAHASARPES
jgi:hypothetical protein